MTFQQRLRNVQVDDLHALTFRSSSGTLPFTVTFYTALNDVIGSQVLAVGATAASSLLHLYRTAIGDTGSALPGGSASLTLTVTGNLVVGFAGLRNGQVDPQGTALTITGSGRDIVLGPDVQPATGSRLVEDSQTVALASDQRIGLYGKSFTLTPTLSASPDYSAGDVVGGIQTLTDANVVSGRPVKLASTSLVDINGQSPALSLLLFDRTPAGGTYTDNAALVLSDDDMDNMVGVVRIVAGDYYTPVSGKTLSILGGIEQILAVNDRNLYALIVCDATWNAGSTGDITLKIGLEMM